MHSVLLSCALQANRMLTSQLEVVLLTWALRTDYHSILTETHRWPPRAGRALHSSPSRICAFGCSWVYTVMCARTLESLCVSLPQCSSSCSCVVSARREMIPETFAVKTDSAILPPKVRASKVQLTARPNEPPTRSCPEMTTTQSHMQRSCGLPSRVPVMPSVRSSHRLTRLGKPSERN